MQSNKDEITSRGVILPSKRQFVVETRALSARTRPRIAFRSLRASPYLLQFSRVLRFHRPAECFVRTKPRATSRPIPGDLLIQCGAVGFASSRLALARSIMNANFNRLRGVLCTAVRGTGW